jgi:uncharacterized protein YcbK (DUF882 family)
MQIEEFKRNSKKELSEYFVASEFDCKCGKCKTTLICLELVECLTWLRKNTASAIHITSGFRCHDHNLKIKGEPKSKHLQGLAADIISRRLSTNQLKMYADRWMDQFYFNQGGIGLARSFLHVDVRLKNARWIYP